MNDLVTGAFFCPKAFFWEMIKEIATLDTTIVAFFFLKYE